MAPRNLLPPDTTVRIETLVDSPSMPELLGYGFATAGTGTLEVQRWLMFTTDLRGKSFPRNPVRIRKTDARDVGWDTIVRHDGPQGFIQKAITTFLQGQHLYILANCDFVQDYPLPALPNPAFLHDPGGGSQGFWGLAPLSLSSALGVGLVYVEDVSTYTRREYWSLFDTYRVPDAASVVEIGKARALGGGDSFAHLVQGHRWTSTCTMAVCSCTIREDRVPEIP